MKAKTYHTLHILICIMISCGILGMSLFLFGSGLYKTTGLYGLGVMAVGCILGLALHNYLQFNEIRSDA